MLVGLLFFLQFVIFFYRLEVSYVNSVCVFRAASFIPVYTRFIHKLKVSIAFRLLGFYF
jgi:hypothetical protein